MKDMMKGGEDGKGKREGGYDREKRREGNQKGMLGKNEGNYKARQKFKAYTGRRRRESRKERQRHTHRRVETRENLWRKSEVKKIGKEGLNGYRERKREIRNGNDNEDRKAGIQRGGKKGNRQKM